MAQVTGPLSIADGAAVAKSFAPVSVGTSSAIFAERSSGVSAGFKLLTVGYSPASSKRATHRVPVSLALPTLSTVNGVSTVAYTGRFDGTFIIPEQMTASERADLVAFVTNGLSLALLKNVVKDLDPLY